MNFIFNLINLAAVEKTKQTNITECQYSTGMSRSKLKNKIEKNVFFLFSNFKKLGREGLLNEK